MRYTEDQLSLLTSAAKIALENGKITRDQYKLLEAHISRSELFLKKRRNIIPGQIHNVFRMAEEVKRDLHLTS